MEKVFKVTDTKNKGVAEGNSHTVYSVDEQGAIDVASLNQPNVPRGHFNAIEYTKGLRSPQ